MGWIIGFLKKLFPRAFGQLAKFLLGFISPLIAPILQFVAKFFSRLGFIVLVIAFIGGSIAAFTAALSAIGSGVSSMAPPDAVIIGQMLLPTNIPIAIATLILARLKSLIFMWVIRLAEKFERT